MIYLLKRLDDVEFDEPFAKVVRAKNETEARRIAADDETEWIDEMVSCELIEPEGDSEVILTDFQHG